MEQVLQSEEKVSLLENARWVTQEQLNRINQLIFSLGGRVIISPHHAEYEDPYGPTIYDFGEEPFVLMNKISKRDPNYVGWIFPSDKHRALIEEAKIMSFEPENEPKGAE